MTIKNRGRMALFMTLIAAMLLVLTACTPAAATPTEAGDHMAETERDHEAEAERDQEDDHDHEGEHEGEDHDTDHDHEGEHDHDADAELVFPVIEAVALDGRALQVVATTTIVGDVVAQVGGETIDLVTLMQPGQDPHSYQPVPQQVAQIEDADLVFTNGFGLEGGLEADLDAIAGAVPVVPVSYGVEVMARDEEHDHEGEEHEDEGEDHEGEDEHHQHGAFDPHTWMSPVNVMAWTDTVARALSEADPANADQYAANAEAYKEELAALDAQIAELLAVIPAENRIIVTDHEAFGYFVARYDLETVGTIVPGSATSSAPSAGELAGLINTIRETGVRAIFVGTTVSDETAQLIADEVGETVSVYSLYTGALDEAGTGADTYIGMMRTNAETIAEALGR